LRKLNYISINIYVPNPAVILGNDGKRLFVLKNSLQILLNRLYFNSEITINVFEVSKPDTNAKLISDFVRQQLERRIPFRRVIKAAIVKAQKADVKGIKVQISGRLNGAEIARTEWVREGQVPLHTLKANIDYFQNKALVL
jgi:small subunit ribosomal protein S3